MRPGRFRQGCRANRAVRPEHGASASGRAINLLDHLIGTHLKTLAASQETVDLYWRLAESRPDAFLPDLGRSVSVTSDV